MSDRPPVRAIRTTLETRQIRDRLRREIPETVTGAHTPGVVAGHVEGTRFELLWSDGDGLRYKVFGLVQEGKSDRLVTIRFRQAWENVFITFATGAMVALPLSGMGDFTVPVSILIVAVMAAASFGVTARLVPPGVVDTITHWLRSRLQPGRLPAVVAHQMVAGYSRDAVHLGDASRASTPHSRSR